MRLAEEVVMIEQGWLIGRDPTRDSSTEADVGSGGGTRVLEGG